MSGKNKALLGAGIGIILVAAGLFIFKKHASDNKDNPEAGTYLQKAGADDQTQLVSKETPGNIMEGILRVSDNKKKGNYMLVMKDRTVYLSTSRDFSPLVGKDVTVSYQGTLDNFVLGNITLK